jgi:hypothetical protein
MYKVQFKAKSPYGAWQVVGNYGTESQAISSALAKKRAGALLVRVLDKSGSIVYTG